MSRYNRCFLTCIHISQEAGQVFWYSHLLKNFPQFVVIHTVKGFDIVNKADFFSRTLLLFWWSSGCWKFDLWFLCLYKSSLNIWKFSIHILLKPGLENFEHYFARMWNECNCVVVWTLFGIALLWAWDENWPLPVLWPQLSFPVSWHIECSTFTESSFRVWNSSTGITSPPLALFMVMFPKAHLTSKDVWL